jgi:cysteine desulfurase
MSARIDLDHNATTRPLPQVIEAMSRHFRESYANPGSRHAEGRTARKALESARESIAHILGARPDELVFTSGGTEASNMAVLGCLGRRERPVIALTAGEHPATTEACRQLVARGFELCRLGVDANGLLREDQYDTLPFDRLALVTIILAHNETGVIQDIGPLAERCRRHSVPLHLDAVQAVGKIPIHFEALGATTLSLGAHKFHGPRGIGALLLKRGTTLEPLLFGGHQESERRPGTEPVALAVGMATALENWHAEHESRLAFTTALRDRLQAALTQRCAPAVVNGAGAPRLPNTLNIAFPGVDGEAMLVALDLEGIACSLGSTCASGSA